MSTRVIAHGLGTAEVRRELAAKGPKRATHNAISQSEVFRRKP